MRNTLRNAFFAILEKAFNTDDGKRAIASRFLGYDTRPGLVRELRMSPSPYADIGGRNDRDSPNLRDDIIFITARFRSGSTLLWNIFRNIDGCTAYYEPFNENCYFDSSRWTGHQDDSHQGVSEVYSEYAGLDALADVYDENWISQDLLMDQHVWNRDMRRYVDSLISHASSRPVLQFNRIDFRLPWIRKHYPNAKIIHLLRHPRDQWCSSLIDIDCFTRHDSAANFESHDKFYLTNWCRDLRYHFPFLGDREIEHPYQQFYFLWRLSYLTAVT